MKSKTQQSAKNLRPKAREKNHPKRKTQENRTTNSNNNRDDQNSDEPIKPLELIIVKENSEKRKIYKEYLKNN